MKGLVALALAYVLSQFYRSFLAVLTPQLTQELGASKSDLSLAAGIWFISFALMQFVVGVCLDRFGPRRTTTGLFGIAATAGALIFATAQTPLAIVIAMCLFGIGCAPVLMASLFIFAQRFNPATFAIMTSWLVAFGNTGNVIGASPLAQAVELFGWRPTLLALAAITFVISVLVFIFVKDPPSVQSSTPGASKSDAHSNGSPEPDSIPNDTPRSDAGLRGYLSLLKIRTLWAIMAMTLLCYAPVVGIRGLWSGPYLFDLYQADSIQIGRITLYMAIAMIIGSLLYGPLDRLLNTRKWVVFSGNLMVLCALGVLILYPSGNLAMATIVFTIIGICGTSYGVIMAHGRSFVPQHLLGRGVTLINFCSMFGAGIMQFASGRLMDAQAQPGSIDSYQVLFGFYGVMLAVALVVYLGSTDSKPSKAVVV